ncbi:MAG TPA: ABC transporter permease [Candidatus Paceibacterota bacterium]|jgi:ABC-type antimicrobial peptide transport system, permease component
MKFQDLFEEIYTALIANKVRTALTMLGIVIGIASVIALVAIGSGAKASIQANIESIGSNLIIVMPGAQRAAGGYQVSTGRGTSRTLVSADATILTTEATLAKAVAPETTSRYQVTAKGTNTNTTVTGTLAAYQSVRNIEIDQGTFITDEQSKSLSKVAVLGPSARDDLFGEGADAVGQTIRIKGMQFKVIGVTKAKGSGGFGSQDDMIFIPLGSAQKFLAGGDYLTTISLQAVDADAMTALQEEATNILLVRHKIADATEADFTVLNQADIVATASSIAGTFTTLLAAVAGISLLVGGIGIMNMMLTTVTERTKEIGLRKAIGATRRDVNLQFLAEAVALTFSGGAMGVILGSAASFLLSSLNVIQAHVSLSSVALAFGVSAGIGIVFGYYPARRAAQMSPIEALRYE